MSAPVLVVNADDLGLTPGVNAGIVEAFERGVVTSSTILAVAPAFDDAVQRCRAAVAAGLGVGVHLALVGEDPPLLAARDVPSLVGTDGRFAASWKQLLPRIAARRVDPGEVRAEFRAQLQRVLESGIVPTHLDSHQHLHLWPAVRDVVVELADEHGIDAIRVPRSGGRGPKALLLNRLAGRLARTAAAAGLRTPEGFAGLDEAGGLDRARLGALIDGLPALASVEIGCHPGNAVDPDRSRYRWGFRWADELDALCDPAIREQIEERGFVLASFAGI